MEEERGESRREGGQRGRSDVNDATHSKRWNLLEQEVLEVWLRTEVSHIHFDHHHTVQLPCGSMLWMAGV